MNLQAFARMTEAQARAFLESLRWPDGPICPHCGVVDEATRMKSGKGAENPLRAGVYNCRACRKPFTVTVGTIFEGSHIPLSKWLVGFYLFASSKKSLSALQLQRQLELGSYRTAWHMAHRIRHAMQNDPNPPKLAGDVEADETWIGGKLRRTAKGQPPHKTPYLDAKDKKTTVAVLVSREQGHARAKPVLFAGMGPLQKFIRENVDPGARILTDEAYCYNGVGRHFRGGHETVNHSEREYARGDVHTNTVESFHGLFKRAVHGAWHHISATHLNRYLNEQCFRWSHRRVSDSERTRAALGRVAGVRLYYKKPRRQAANGGEDRLVAGGPEPTR